MIRTARLAAVTASVLALAACAHFHHAAEIKPTAAPNAASAAPVRQLPAQGGIPVVDKRPKGRWAQTFSDIAPDPNVKFGTLPNGMRYAIMRNVTPTGQASVRLRFDAGSMMERDDQQGLAHFLEHMAFNGSKKVPEGEMIKILERHGLAFGADTNASTGFEETVYQLDLPKTDDDTVDTSLMLMRQAASELLIAQDAMDRERGVVLSEERTRDTPQLHSFVDQLTFTMPNNLAPKRLPIGKTDILKNAPASLIRDFYNHYYRPERATLVVVGDFDPAAMEAKIVKQFGDWKAVGPAGPEPVRAQPLKRGPEAKVHVEAGIPLAINLAWTAPPDFAPDSKAKRLHDLKRMLGFAAFNRRLERISRSASPPFIFAGAFAGDQFHSADVTSLSVTAQPGKWKEALSAAEQEERRLVQFGLSQQELDREIDQLRADLKQRAASAATRRTPQLADEIVGTLGDDIVETNPVQDLAMFEDQVKGMTAADVSAIMRQSFSGNGPLVFLSSPTPVEGGDATVMAALNDSRKVQVAAAAAEVQKTWPYENWGPTGKVAERTEITDLDTVFVRFENGVRLTVKPTKFTRDQILVSARFGDGRLGLPTDKISAAWAAPASFTEGGLDQLTAEETETILRSKIVSAAVGVDDDAVLL
ncbi:MAG TPA: pitrilysin family protein, partial [Caulobacteraceae bacterium]|nr:pitrilysin family protein [Caulobacteraceae bacterium]